jgi:hypothetical protein
MFTHKSYSKFTAVNIRYRFYNNLILNLKEKGGRLEENTIIRIVKIQLPARHRSWIERLQLVSKSSHYSIPRTHKRDENFDIPSGWLAHQCGGDPVELERRLQLVHQDLFQLLKQREEINQTRLD